MAIAGLDDIENFYRGAADGVFRMDEGTATACAAVVQTLIDGLTAQRPAALLMRIESNDTFDSARDMFDGFNAKANEFLARLLELIAAAERLKSSFEIAGATFAAVEVDNASGIRRAGDGG